MLPERDRYESLLESVADGAEVDWAALDAAAATVAEKKRYRNLRLVARVAELHRTLVLEEEDRVATSLDADAVSADPSTWGHLSIAARLASGAFGQIYRAHDSQLNRSVALKLLRRDIALVRPVDRLLDEARTLAQVDHPNVVTVHGADVRDGRAGLWMELVDGQTLEAWLAAHGPMGAREVVSIGMDLCGALAAVHSKALVHGDVKAQNVMREKGGRIVLMDFGAGRPQGVEAVGVAGTPMYLAPEVLAGAPPTAQSDLYSLGVLLFHLITGSFPYSAIDIDSLRAAHADGSRTWLRDLRPDLPHSLVHTIERAIDPDPARRFTTAGAMEQTLHRDVVPIGVAAHPLDNRADREPITWLQPGFAIAALVFIAAVVGLVIWSRTPANRDTVLSGIRTIGVLPMSESKGSGLSPDFAGGLTEELISSLGQVQALTVKSGSSLGSIEGKSDKEISRALDVDALLKTTVSAVGGSAGSAPQVRVQARLLAAGTQWIVWSDDFNAPLGASSRVANAIAAGVSRAVKISLTSAEAARLTSVHQTNPAAEEAYLEGRRQLGQYGTGSADQALNAFKRALGFDSGHPSAHSGAARAYVMLGLNGGMPHAEARALALSESRQALALDPDLAEAHAALAHIYFIYDWAWAAAEDEFVRSLALNPSLTYARTFYAEYLAAQGRFADAVTHAETAKRLDPESGDAARRYALVLYYKHDFSAAERALEDAVAVEPSAAGLPLLRGRFAEAHGQFAEALEHTREALQRSGGGGVPLRIQELRLMALAGQRTEALERLTALEQESGARQIRVNTRDLAYFYFALGNTPKALELFNEALSERDPTLVWIGVDPRLDTLQNDPRFRRLLQTIGVPARPGATR